MLSTISMRCYPLLCAAIAQFLKVGKLRSVDRPGSCIARLCGPCDRTPCVKRQFECGYESVSRAVHEPREKYWNIVLQDGR